MATLVFAHSPIATPTSWVTVAALAASAGFNVRTPSLTEAIFASDVGGPPCLVHCAQAIARAAHGCANPILIAHSGAGMLLPAAARAMRDAPRGAIIVDGLMPQPGKSWFDTASPTLSKRIRALAQDGLVAPWHEWWPPGAVRSLFRNDADYAAAAEATPRMPLAYFEEAAPPTEMPAIPCGYLRLSAACDGDADAAAALGWRVRRSEMNHIAMITEPAAVWAELAALIDAMGLR